MRHYILSFFLIFAFAAMPSLSYACWDDDYDDYYGYDDDDDYYYDWWSDDEDNDDDYDYDWGNNNGDDDDDCIDGGTLDEVIITPDDDYDWGLDDDWWRTDYGDNDDCGDDDDDSDNDGIGSYHTDNNNKSTVVTPPLLPYEVHKPESNEKLFKENLPVRYPGQTCTMNCFTTTLAICNALMNGDFSFNDYITYLSAIEHMFYFIFDREICERGIKSYEMNKFLTEGCGLIYDYINESSIASCIDNGDLVMVTIGNGSHEVAIVGYYNDFEGIDAYQCVNPGNGKYETHYGYEFDKDIIIRYFKNNH